MTKGKNIRIDGGALRRAIETRGYKVTNLETVTGSGSSSVSKVCRTGIARQGTLDKIIDYLEKTNQAFTQEELDAIYKRWDGVTEEQMRMEQVEPETEKRLNQLEAKMNLFEHVFSQWLDSIMGLCFGIREYIDMDMDLDKASPKTRAEMYKLAKIILEKVENWNTNKEKEKQDE